MEGRLIAGRYLVERLLGAGGMGQVFLAEQLPLRRRVALKLLREGRRASEEDARRAIREAQTASSLEHDSVVRVLDAGRTEAGETYIAFEYLRGLTLKQLLAERSFLPWPWAVKATLQVLSALEALHQRGLVHRDVKPSNCFCLSTGDPLTSEPRIKLIDFGIAKLSQPSPEDLITADGQAFGTPAYAAPEQAQGGSVDARADLYGVGVSLYELLTGKLPAYAPPSERGSPRSGVRPPSASNPGAAIPPALDAIVLRALAPDPSERFASARAMHAAISRVLDREESPSVTSTLPGTARTAVPDGEDTTMGRSATLPVAPAPRTRSPSPDATQLARLRKRVEQFWIAGVLTSALQGTTLVAQLWTTEEEWIAGPGAILEPSAPIALSEDHPIAELFEECGRSLLLLGDPGTGKTMQLLILARALLASDSPIVPVVLSLATWTDAPRSLRAWMVEELAAHYQVPAAFGVRWISEGLVLPLLDGLDEAPAATRDACVDAINEAMRTDELPGIIVTTRIQEYRSLSGRLRLNRAVVLHRLSRDVVAQAFRENPVLAGLSDERRGQLLSLAESPLALSLLLQVASVTLHPAKEWDVSKDPLPWLLDSYVDRMLSRSGKKKLTIERGKLVLVVEHLAWAMRRNSCTVFQTDALQPSWLERRESLWLYALGSRMAAATILGAGLILSFGKTPLGADQGFHATLGFGALVAAGIALTTGAASGLSAGLRLRATTRPRREPLAHWIRVLALALPVSAANAAAVGWWQGHSVAAVMAFEGSLVAVAILSPHPNIGDRRAEIRSQEVLRFSWTQAVRAAPIGLLLGGLAFFGASGERETAASLIAMAFALGIVLLFGGLRGRDVEESTTPSGRIRRSLRTALFVATAGAAPTTAFMGLRYGAPYGLSTGLTIWTLLWLWYGGFAVIQHALVRALLSRERQEYCDERYLTAAIERALLYRVGNGAMFIHPLFMAHLASRFSARRNTA